MNAASISPSNIITFMLHVQYFFKRCKIIKPIPLFFHYGKTFFIPS